MSTKLIIVEGLPGSGKSTAASLDERGTDWLNAVIGYHVSWGYGKKNGLSGYDGYIKYLEERKRRELEILRSLDIRYFTVREHLTAAGIGELLDKI